MRDARSRASCEIYLTGPDASDDTSADHERFEAELIAHDQDAARVATADVDHETARQLVSDLVDAGIIIPIAEKRVFIHEPSREAFESVSQLAVFHEGWTAAYNAGEETS